MSDTSNATSDRTFRGDMLSGSDFLAAAPTQNTNGGNGTISRNDPYYEGRSGDQPESGAAPNANPQQNPPADDPRTTDGGRITPDSSDNDPTGRHATDDSGSGSGMTNPPPGNTGEAPPDSGPVAGGGGTNDPGGGTGPGGGDGPSTPPTGGGNGHGSGGLLDLGTLRARGRRRQ